MWKRYPFHLVPNYKHHYESERSYGVIAFSMDCKRVLVIRSKTDTGTKLGFPQGHANDYESDWEAATRETYEEAGVKVPQDAAIIGNVMFTYPVTYTEANLDKHLVEMEKRKERPYWNRPGTYIKTVKLYVIKMNIQPTKTEANSVVQEALWLNTVTALLEMEDTKSNRLPAMIDAIKMIGGKSMIM